MARGSIARSVKDLGSLLDISPGDLSRSLASQYRINVEISDEELVTLRDQPQSHKETRLVSQASRIKRPSKEIPKKEDNGAPSLAVTRKIIGRLNELAGRDFRPTAKATVKYINARLAEGFTEADLAAVVEDRLCRTID